MTYCYRLFNSKYFKFFDLMFKKTGDKEVLCGTPHFINILSPRIFFIVKYVSVLTRII